MFKLSDFLPQFSTKTSLVKKIKTKLLNLTCKTLINKSYYDFHDKVIGYILKYFNRQ